MAVLLSALNELSIKRLKNVYLLLTHRLTQLVRLTFREACNLLGDKHDLLLIDGDTIGLLQELLHGRKVIRNRLVASFSGNERRNVVHRTRTIQRIHRDKVLETLRMQLLEPLHHTRGLELEHTLRIAIRINLISLRVVNRNFFNVNVNAESLLDFGKTYLDDCQCLEAEEVHLQHTYVLDERTLILGHPNLLVGSLIHTQGDRDIVSKVASSDNHRAGMDTDLADAPLKLEGIFQHFLHQFRAVFQLVLQLRNIFDAVLQCRLLLRLLLYDLEPLSVFFNDFVTLLRHFVLLQFHFGSLRDGDRLVRNHLGEPVGLFKRKPADSCDVLDGTLCRHRTESDDMGNMIDTISVLHILDDTITSVIIEVNVNIRH